MKANIFDKAFSDLLVKSPPKQNQEQVSDEAWGDINEQYTYQDQYRPTPAPTEQYNPDAYKAQGPSQSKVVQKYFKPAQKKPVAAMKAPPKTIDKKAQELINAQMEELEREVAKLKKAKGQIKRAKTSIEDRKGILENQKKILRDNQQKGYAETRSWKEQEMQKLQKEAKTRERNAKQLSTLPTKKDRIKWDELKAEIKKVAEETKKKESRHKFALERMTKQIEDLTEKNTELKREVGSKPVPAEQAQPKENSPYSMNLSPVKRSPAKAASPVKSQSISDPQSGQKLGSGQKNNARPAYLNRERSPSPSDEQSAVRSIDDVIESPPKQHKSSPDQRRNSHDPFSITQEESPFVLAYPTVPSVHTPPSSDSENKSDSSDSENEQTEQDPVIELLYLEDGKERKVYKSGLWKTVFPNGTVKELHTDQSTKVYFPNGDILQTLVDNTQIYTYAADGLVQENYPSGLKIFTFNSGQREAHHPDGTIQVTFPDGSRKMISPEGDEIVQKS